MRKKSFSRVRENALTPWVAPTHARGPNVVSTLLGRTPVLPAHYNMRGQLYYDYNINIAPAAAGLVGSYVFSANGMYDPNITSTGHQPIGFDQLMALYTQYTVLRSRIRVAFCGNSDKVTRVAIYLSPDGVAQGLPELMENGLLVSDLIVSQTDTQGDGYRRIKVLELTCDVPRYFGKSQNGVLADPELLGTAASNPTEQVYFVLAVWGPFGTGTSVNVDVVISYDARYWEPRKLASS